MKTAARAVLHHASRASRPAAARSSLRAAATHLGGASSRGYRSDLIGTNLHDRHHLEKDPFYESRVKQYTQPMKESKTVTVTGPAGQIGYSLLFRLASGEMLGIDQPIYINCLELPMAMEALKGVVMELRDCAFPLVKGILMTEDAERAFEHADYALLVGSKPRGPGQERGDLLNENGGIFTKLGKALNKTAKRSCKTIVVGNPANTNCLICAHNAPDLPAENFTSMIRLDHDRGLAQTALKTGKKTGDITDFCVWGNHSPTMFPDLLNAKIDGKPVKDVVGEGFDSWYNDEFMPTVQQRGAAIIDARGKSSAASAANACITQVRDWQFGNDGRWASLGVKSDGQYGIPEGLYSGFPVTLDGEGNYSVVPDIDLSAEQEAHIKTSVDELISERDAVVEHLK